MTATLYEQDVRRELEEAPEELRITEAAAVVPATEKAEILARAKARGIEMREGEELLQIIRPTVGRGKGTNYYGPEMLEADAPNWKGTKLFRNHLTETERRKLEGLPRPIEHLAGRIREAWWDGDVPPSADGRFERGGTYSLMRPTRFIRETLDDDPELIDTSISALATAKHPGTVNGQRCQIVEGIRLKPRSVDFVTEGGAGGRVLRESAHDEEEGVLESMTDDEVIAYVKANRPGLIEAMANDPDGDGDDDTAEINKRAAKHMKLGKSRKEAVALARQEIADAADETKEGADMPEFTPEALAEALSTDEGKAAFAPVLTPLIQEALSGYEPEGFVRTGEMETLVESRMAERADLIRIEARGDLERQIELRDMRDKAAKLVESAKLPKQLATRIEAAFTLSEAGEPSAALDVTADLDEQGNVVKSAMVKLEESVNAEIKDARELVAGLRPTRVRGAGASTRLVEAAATKGDEDKTEEERGKSKRSSTGSSLADELLESAGFSNESLGQLWTNGL